MIAPAVQREFFHRPLADQTANVQRRRADHGSVASHRDFRFHRGYLQAEGDVGFPDLRPAGCRCGLRPETRTWKRSLRIRRLEAKEQGNGRHRRSSRCGWIRSQGFWFLLTVGRDWRARDIGDDTRNTPDTWARAGDKQENKERQERDSAKQGNSCRAERLRQNNKPWLRVHLGIPGNAAGSAGHLAGLAATLSNLLFNIVRIVMSNRIDADSG